MENRSLETIVKILSLPIMINIMLIKEIAEDIDWIIKYGYKIKELSNETNDNGEVTSINIVWKDEV